MYHAFLSIIRHYRILTGRRVFVFEWVIPFILTSGIFVYKIMNPRWASDGSLESIWPGILSSSQNIVGVMLAFSIASITIFATSEGDNIKFMRDYPLDKTNPKTKRRYSYYQYVLTNLSFLILIEVFTIIIGLLVLAFVQDYEKVASQLASSVVVFLLLHILLLTVRNIQDIYGTLFRDERKEREKFK